MTTPTNLIVTDESGEASGDGFTAGTFTAGEVSGSGSLYVTDAQFNDALQLGTVTLAAGTEVELGFADDPAMTVAGTGPLIVNAPTVAINTGVTIDAGATVFVADSNVVGSGTLTINQGGVVSVPGAIAVPVTVGGVLDDTGLIYVQGATAVASGGSLTVVSNGTTATFADTTDSGALAVTFDAQGGAEVIGTAELDAMVAQNLTQTVGSSAQLFAAIRLVDELSDGLQSIGTHAAFSIDIANNITLTQQLDAVNLGTLSSLTINGEGGTLDGGGSYNGLFVYDGATTIENLTIAHARAVGGKGGDGIYGGGGGAGLGGGLFVASKGDVSLSGVFFNSDSATGGNGGNGGFTYGYGYAGSGGLDGGAGGSVNQGSSGGGGGVGLSAFGGQGSPGNGGAGIIPGALPGTTGTPPGSSGVGGVSGGGGGDGFRRNHQPGGGLGGATAGFGGGGVPGTPGGFGGGAGGFGGGGEIYDGTGFGGGNFSSSGGGGGGLGAGGDVFVQQGGTLIIAAGTLGLGTVRGGQGGAGSSGGGGGSGEGLGSALFVQGTATLDPGAGQTISVVGGIADQTGGGTLLLDGAGTVALLAANTQFGGTLDINTGTLAVTGAGTPGTGTIVLVGTASVLKVDAGATTPTNKIAGFVGHDAAIDLANLPYEAGAQGTIVNNTLTAISGGQTVDLNLVSGSGTVLASSDGSGGTMLQSPQYALQFTLPQILSFDGTLPGFALGDEITIANETFTSNDISYDPSTGTLTVNIPGTTAASIALNPAEVPNGAQFAAIPVSGGTAIVLSDTITVNNELDLNQAIATADAGTNAAYDIVFGTGVITEGTDTGGTITVNGGATRAAPADLLAFNPGTIVSVTVDGQGGTLAAANLNAFFAYQGDITIQNLTISDARAVGGNGGDALVGGGGGAGLGGGLFVASGADVTLSNDIFNGNSASGGNGGNGGFIGEADGYGGGGGLDGGNGGSTNTPSYGGGGGGVGVGATGGGGASGVGSAATNASTPGGPGIIPGAGAADSGNPNSYPGHTYAPGAGGASAGGGGEGAIVGGHGGVAGNFGGGAGGQGGNNGGFGGGGGGFTHGAGGFGGGGNGNGGSNGSGGGAGGFGAGAGGAGAEGPSSPFYNPNLGGGPPGGGGGGGLGAGGDIFIQQGATLNIEDGSLGAGTVNPGTGGTGTSKTSAPGAQVLNGQNGQAFGGSMFIQGSQVVTLAPGAGLDLSIAGVISDQDGAYYSIGEIPQTGSTGIGTLAIGAGTVTLSGDNTFSGLVIVQNAGSVVVGADNALGLAGATVTISATGSTIAAETVAVASNLVTLGAGTGLGFSADATIDQPIGISGVPTLFAQSGVAGSIAGVISGSSDFIVGGAGGVTLDAANSFVGDVTVLGGATLGLTADDNLGPGGNVPTLEAGSTLAFADSFTLDRALVLEGDPTFSVVAGATGTVDTVLSDGTTVSNVVMNGAGTLVLATDNTYTGGTTIDLGTLRLAAATAASTGPVVFAGSGGGTLDLSASTVVVAPTASGTNAVTTASGNDVILNSGSIIGASGSGGAGGATGASLSGGGTLSNAGTVEGGAGTVGGWGVFLNGGSADNQAGALIQGGSASGDNHGAGLGVNMGSGAILTNEGTIVGGAGGTGDGATGVNLFPGTLTNSGLIESGAGGGAAGVYIAGGTLITSGTVEANPIGAGDSAVLFAGGLAGTMVVDPGAVLIGAVDANTDSTIELSGTEATPFGGFGTQITGLGTVEFAPNAQWTVAGNASGLGSGQVIADFAAGDTIDLTGVGNDSTVTANGGGSFTFSGSGATTANLTFTGLPAGTAPGVTSDDAGGTDISLVQTTFTITSQAQLLVDAGLISQGGANAGVNFDYTFILAPTAGTIALKPLGEPNLNLDSGAILDVTGVSGFLNGALDLGNAVSLLPSQAGASGLIFSNSAADLTNGALIEGAAGTGGANGGTGLDMTAGGTLTNNATIEGGAGAGGGEGVVLNSGSLDNAGGALIAGGAATGDNHFFGLGVAMGGGTLTNQGTIMGGAGGGGQDGATGLNLLGGAVTNAGLIEGGTGGGGGTADGIYVGTAFSGTISNTGTLRGGSGAAGGEGVSLNGGSLDNAAGGLILGGAATGDNLGLGLGAAIGNGATLTNEGSIEGGSSTGGSGATGVNLNTGSLVNSGFIEGGAGGNSAGVYISGGRLTTSGTIAENTGSGSEAVLFSGAGTMEVDPGAVFIGAVEANTADTIVLGGSTAASLAGFGTQITGLGTLTFATGAQWTVTGNAAGLAAGQVLSGFAQGDTIDLTGVGTETAVTPGAGDTETLSGAGATSATLTFGAALPTGDGLALAPDGTGGTLVWLVQTGTPSIAAPAIATVGVNQPGSLGSITISEAPTSVSETFTLTLSDNNGVLAANTGAIGGGGSVSAAGTTLTISGTLDQVNADLTTLTDDDPTTPSDTVSLALSDSNGGSATPASTTVTVNGVPSISVPGSAGVAQNVATGVAPVSVSETGNTTTSGESFTVTLSDSAGVLAANTSAIGGGGTISPSGTTLTISGTLAQVNADLTSLTDDDATTSPDTISVSVLDSFGNSATEQSIPVTVTPAANNTFDAHVYLDANGDGAQDNGETGLSGVTVDLLDGSGNPTGQSLTTNAGGDVSFTSLAPGSYEISVVNPGGDAVSQTTNTLTPNTLAGGQTANATEGVYVPATFSVHVYDDSNADGAQDGGETGLAGVTVDLLTGAGDPTGKSSITDANGDASFTSLAPGSYQVSVVKPAGDAVTQASNTLSANTLSSGGSASATEGVYAPPALTQPTLTLTVTEGHSLGNLWSELLANGVDPNPSSLTITAVGTSGTQGSVTLSSASQSLVYIATGLNPSEPIDSFNYTLKDGTGGTVTGTVDVTVTGPNLPTTVATTPGSTATATGAGQRLIAESTGERLIGGSAGGDELFGGPDTSIAAAGSGNTIYVEPGNHVIGMGVNNNTATLNDGNDVVSASGTGDTVTGGNGNDTVTGMTGNATISLGNGNDTVTVSGANNSITVGTGTDHISAGTGGGETIVAGDGANTISAGGSNDKITAGNGKNSVTATGASATITLGNGGDTVGATGAGDKITTGSGNDTIVVTAGSAIIKAGLGSNTIRFAGSGNDVVNQGGSDTLTDTGTNNTIVLPLAGQGLDTINGSVLSNGDTFDLRAALAATTWDQQLSDLGSYLTLGTSGSNALVELSTTSGGTPVTVAVLNGSGPVTLSSFVSHALLT